MYNFIECGMPMVTALTPNTAEAMRTQVVHLSPTVVASMRTAEGGTKTEAHQYPYGVVIHPQTKRGDGQSIQLGT